MRTISIVDDNMDNTTLLEALLRDSYNIKLYYSGLDALKGIAKEPPDLIILDISLPDISGIEVFHEIRANHLLKSLPIIALTACAMKGDSEKYLQIGFDAYLSKPIVSEDILLNAIKGLLQAKQTNYHE